jgi:hypothetical protein
VPKHQADGRMAENDKNQIFHFAHFLLVLGKRQQIYTVKWTKNISLAFFILLQLLSLFVYTRESGIRVQKGPKSNGWRTTYQMNTKKKSTRKERNERNIEIK